MTARTFVFSKLSQVETAGAGTRVFAKKDMTSSREMHPYIVYKLGYSAPEGLTEAEGYNDPNRQFIQVFIHDYTDEVTADYMQIDEVIKEVKAIFKDSNSAEDGVIAVRYLETSQDLDDNTLNTVMKYIRFQLITKE